MEEGRVVLQGCDPGPPCPPPEFPWWTFSHEDSRSFGLFELQETSGSSFNVSFFLRSLKPDGLLFQLRRPAPAGGRVYFSVYLGMGRLFISSLPHSSSLSAPVFVTGGEKKLLRIEVQQSQVVFEHAGLRYRVGQIPEVSAGAGDQAFVGGLPADLDSGPWGGHYKGCLQDFRFNSVRLEPEARGPSEQEVDASDQEVDASDQEANVAQEADSIRPGCISDDTCKVRRLQVPLRERLHSCSQQDSCLPPPPLPPGAPLPGRRRMFCDLQRLQLFLSSGVHGEAL